MWLQNATELILFHYALPWLIPQLLRIKFRSSYLLDIWVSLSFSKMHERNGRQGSPHRQTKRRSILHVFCFVCSCPPRDHVTRFASFRQKSIFFIGLKERNRFVKRHMRKLQKKLHYKSARRVDQLNSRFPLFNPQPHY